MYQEIKNCKICKWSNIYAKLRQIQGHYEFLLRWTLIFQVRKKDQINIESKLKTVRFIGIYIYIVHTFLRNDQHLSYHISIVQIHKFYVDIKLQKFIVPHLSVQVLLFYLYWSISHFIFGLITARIEKLISCNTFIHDHSLSSLGTVAGLN